MSNWTITEADRATAFRVIRRHVGAGPNAIVPPNVFYAACLAAAQGRQYAAALRGAK